MKKTLLLSCVAFLPVAAVHAQSCAFDSQITTIDSVLCAGDSTTLNFSAITGTPADTVLPTPIVNNNGQDGNMFDISATNTIRIRYFEGNIANTPSVTTQYYIYYKVGTHVGFETNSAAWTLLAGPLAFNPNTPNALTVIPFNVNVIIPAGQTYAFYLTNTSAISNNNRYHNGTVTGAVAATNSDLTVYEGTGGAYPFGTFFNARPWEGIVHYDYPPTTYLWSTGATTPSITVQPGTTTDYSCLANVGGGFCFVEDTISVQVNSNPVVALGNDSSICLGNTVLLDAGNAGSTYAWCSSETTQTISVGASGSYCVNVTDANGCSGSDTVLVTVNSLPSVTTTGDSICFGSTGNLNATGDPATYLWNPGALSGGSVNDAPSFTTTYTVTATDANGCSTIDSAMIVVNQLPVTQTTGDTICNGSTGTITVAGTSTNYYLWAPGNLPGDSVSVNPASTTTYTLTTIDVNGCSSYDSAMVVVNALPSLAVSGDTICQGETGTLNATGSGISYLWNPGSLSGPTVNDSPSSTTTYTVTTTDVNNCMSSLTTDILVNALPSVSVSSFGTHCLDDGSFTLSGGSPAGGTYSGAGVSSGSLTPLNAGNGTHMIAYSYTDANGCSASDSASVIINPCTGIISQTSATGIKVYPNPFHESAVVVIDENTVLDNATFTLYDITGKIVMEMKNVNSTTISINRNTLENGVYFYTFTNNGVVIGSGKIVVD